MADSFYVYYRVELQHSDAARPAVEAMLAAIKTQCGVEGRLMHRADDATTWMEIYEDVGDAGAFRQRLEAAVTTSGLLQHIVDGKRYVEHFQTFARPR